MHVARRRPVDLIMATQKIRVENLSTVTTTWYQQVTVDRVGIPIERVRSFSILFIKPFQDTRENSYGPPLGILTLAAGLRRYFGEKVTVHFRDMNIYNEAPEELRDLLDFYNPDVVGVSALNCEAVASYEIARIVKQWDERAMALIGGPFTLRQAPVIFENSYFDWVFEGPADRTLLEALARHFSGEESGDDLPGFNYRLPDGTPFLNHGQDLIKDMDRIPVPAWDMHDFERYRRRDRKRIITNVGERKYAFLFTSRGCPYLCNYCHDLFTKRFVYQSDERVLEEMRLLYEEYGVREFHFIDDIFNLHKPRVQSIMRGIRERWPGELYIAFPNGLRGDILDAETIRTMVEAGTYHATISIETVTPRLQDLVEKHLDIEQAMWAIDEFARYGVTVQGAFMLGFPTETVKEINATVRYAIRSKLTHAYFFSVIPQPQTPIHELAMRESEEAALETALNEQGQGNYDSERPWYSRAYSYNLERRISNAYMCFYFYPPRFIRLIRIYHPVNLVQGFYYFANRFLKALWRTCTHGLLGRLGDAQKTVRTMKTSR